MLMLEKMYDAVTGFAVGDALGVPYEFKKRGTFVCEGMRASTFKDSHFPLPLGSWSDDTALMLAVVDSLCTKDKKVMRKKWRNNAISWMLFGKYTNHLYRILYDVGGACRRGIVSTMFGVNNKRANNIKANGNGGLMRVLPIAFLYTKNDEEILEYIRLFNKCSHNHNISHMCCLFYVKLAKNLIHGYNFKKTFEMTLQETDMKYAIPEMHRIYGKEVLALSECDIRSTGYVVDTLEAVIWCLSNAQSYSEAVLKAVNLGGDTDTIAALVGGLAGIAFGDVPSEWVENTRREQYLFNKIQDFHSIHDAMEEMWRARTEKS